MDIQQQEIINHALSSTENLNIMISVGQAYAKWRELLVKNLSNYLEEKLKAQKWETNFTWSKAPLANYTGFTCRKEHWPAHLQIVFEAQLGGDKDYIIGIVGQKENKLMIMSLFNQCNVEMGNGKQKGSWMWYRSPPSKYCNFDTADTLFLLHEKYEFADYLLSEIDQLAKVIDSILGETN